MTDAPQRIQLSRAEGWRMPLNTVKVDRSTKWGNPFVVGAAPDAKAIARWGWVFSPAGKRLICEDAQEAVDRFRITLATDPAGLALVRRELAGKNLACWCALGAPCHGHPLIELANS